MSRKQYQLPHRDDSAPPDDTGCTILHIDMDAFYASVSLLSRPDLKGKPVIIGGGGNRAVVLSATYEARAFGVTAAIPMAHARRMCPQAVVLEPDHRRYAATSQAVMATFHSITDQVEPLSLDEAFLDIGSAVRRLGSPATIGRQIRQLIEQEQGITASVGVAPTKYVAKLASGLAKPDGLVVVPVDEMVSFLHQLPVGALWGVGERMEESLHRIGLRTVADIAHMPLPQLTRSLGERTGRHLHDMAWGRDPRQVAPTREEKSIGSNETFPVDVADPQTVHRELLKMAERTAIRVRDAGMLGRTVTITVRFTDFTTITRSRTLPELTDVSREIHAAAKDLYDRLDLGAARIRLVGVRLEGLVDAARASVQGRLDEPERGWREADRAIDQARARFGSGVVRPASLIRGSTESWSPKERE